MAKRKRTIDDALRSAARAAKGVELLINGLTGVNGFITAEIEDNIRPELRLLKREIAAARRLAGPGPNYVVDLP